MELDLDLKPALEQEHAMAVRDWLDAGLPLVVARQHQLAAGMVRLGLSLPAGERRQRIELIVPRSAIARGAPPLALSQALAGAPAAWRPRLAALCELSAACAAPAHVYGSLAAEIESGRPQRRPGSDIDLLFEVGPTSALQSLLAGLRALAGGEPLIDGELRFAGGWAVAWRELDAALARGPSATVLAKSEHDLRLMDVGALVHGSGAELA